MKTIQISDAAADRLAAIGMEGIIAAFETRAGCSCQDRTPKAPAFYAVDCRTPELGEYSQAYGGFVAGQLRDECGRLYDLVVVTDCCKKPILPGEFEYGSYGTKLSHADHYTDGFANTEALACAGSPLAKAVYEKDFNGFRDCYIPAIGELNIIRANLPELLPKKVFWSSTQNGDYHARYQTFEYGHSYWYYEDTKFHACVVRRVYR